MSEDRELITVAVGGFGVLAATQWANGLSHFEVEHSNCTFQELNRRHTTTHPLGHKALRAVFLDQSHSSSIRDEQPVESVDKNLEQLNVNPNLDVLSIFGSNNKNSHNNAAASASSSKKNSTKDDRRNNRGFLSWPGRSAASLWAGHLDNDDEEEEEEEEDEDDNYPTGDSDDDDFDENDPSASVARALVKHVHRPPSHRAKNEGKMMPGTHTNDHGDDNNNNNASSSSPHHGHRPWWQYLTAPHHSDLSRVVSFADFAQRTTDAGGWGQLRSFGFGAFNRDVHHHIERDTQFVDNLRKEIEACDRMQGIQLFVDSDSAFGGIATHLVSDVIGDDFGIKRCFTNSCFPDPGSSNSCSNNGAAPGSPASPLEKLIFSTGCETRLLAAMIEMLNEDHRNLNRGLATSMLSQASACYIPHEIVSWGSFFGSAARGGAEAWNLPGLDTTDDIATAAIVANWSDTVLMPCRGVIVSGDKSEHDAVSVSGGAGVAGSVLGRGTFDLPSFMELLRPSPTLRVAAAFNAMPFLGADPAVAPSILKAQQLIREQQQEQEGGGRGQHSSSSRDSNNELPALLFNLLESSAPLLDTRRAFKPLSAIAVNLDLLDTNSNAVVAHTYCIRAGMPFVGSAGSRQSMREALMQYSTSQIRSPSFVGFAVREPRPIAGTFPRRVFVPKSYHDDDDDKKKEKEQQAEEEEEQDEASKAQKAKKLEQRKSEAAFRARIAALRTVSTGAHAVTTHAAGAYLNQVHGGALRRSTRLRGEHFKESLIGLDQDMWRELEEDLAALRDAYDYEDPSGQHDDADDY